MIVGALLCRNEADRYLTRSVKNAQQFCDQIVALDDHSTDNTPELLQELGVHLITPLGCCSNTEGFWGNDETPARATLWSAACDAAGPDGWIYVFDADHELLGISQREFQRLCESRIVNAWKFVLWDCWDSDEYHRVDGYWQAWHTPRPWLFRAPPPDFEADWGDRRIHTGHVPRNLPVLSGVAPVGCGIRHLGYVQEKDRLTKARRYLALAA